MSENKTDKQVLIDMFLKAGASPASGDLHIYHDVITLKSSTDENLVTVFAFSRNGSLDDVYPLSDDGKIK